MFKNFCFLLIYFFSFSLIVSNDLTLVGYSNIKDGIGQIIPNLINTLKNDLNIKIVNSRKINSFELTPNIQHYIEKNSGFLNDEKVTIFCDLTTWYLNKLKLSKINFAYAMCESTAVPKDWSYILNERFDGLIVPDNFLIKVFKNSGIKIPIFVLPLPIDLTYFLKQPIKKKANKIFTFGCTAAFWERKNHLLLIKAFNEEFGDNKNICLKMNGRFGDMFDYLKNYINSKKITNIELSQSLLTSSQYINFLQSLDCFVLISKGEGYSISPREALSLGMPCILSNNTAHRTICKSGSTHCVSSNIKKQVKKWPDGTIEYNFDCDITDIRNALKYVYQNYQLCLNKSINGRQWVKQYLPENLKIKYLSLIKPKKVIFGNKNLVTKYFIMTDSKELYNKYLKVFNLKTT